MPKHEGPKKEAREVSRGVRENYRMRRRKSDCLIYFSYGNIGAGSGFRR
jgi:hypothetical protein